MNKDGYATCMAYVLEKSKIATLQKLENASNTL